MSTLQTTNLKNPTSGSNNIVLASDGSATIATLASTTITGTTITGTTVTGIIKSGTISGPHPLSPAVGIVDYTGIPSWAKRITICFQGVSLTSTANLLIQVGTSSGVVSSGYVSTGSTVGASSVAGVNSIAGFIVYSTVATTTISGTMMLVTLGSNAWVQSHSGKNSTSNTVFGGGDVTLSGTLDRVRITTTGSDTFDLGSFNILYEG